MSSISRHRQWKKLREKEYREHFVAAAARRIIPFQVRAIMRRRKISQQQLAERSGLTQGVVSRASNPAYGRLTLNTIIRTAAGLDVAFIGLFVPFSKLNGFMDRFSEEALADVPTFQEEDAALLLTDSESVDTANRSRLIQEDTAKKVVVKKLDEVPPPRVIKADLPQPPDFRQLASYNHGED